jgi:hypothetical protein
VERKNAYKSFTISAYDSLGVDVHISGMDSEFHIFASGGKSVVVRQTGLYGSRDFPSLGEATRHLREYTKEKGGLVVIHDEDDHRVNRIPLRVTV